MKRDEKHSTRIREATIDDIERILRLRTERRSTWTREEFLVHIKDECLWLAERDGEPCALLGLWPRRMRKVADSAEVAVLYETRPFDGEVMAALLAKAGEQARRLRAEVDAPNREDCALFEALGFAVKKAPRVRKKGGAPGEDSGYFVFERLL